MLLLNINRKAYKESPMTSSHLTLSDLERSNSRSLRFWSLISCKGAELGHMLPWNINRKAYMGSPIVCLHWLCRSDLERSMSKSLRFWRFICHKWAKNGHMLLVNSDRKPYIGRSVVSLHSTLVTLKGQFQGHSDLEGLYLIQEPR